jgi:hypothetical protein
MSITNAFKANRSLTTTGATEATGIAEVYGGGHRGGGVQLTGTFTGTVQFEESLDGGTTWIAKTVFPAAGGGGVTSATATGQWKFALGGGTHFRARCSAFTSGPIVVDIALTRGVDAIGLTGSASGGGAADGATLTKASVTMSGSSAALVAASASRAIVIVSNTAANAVAAVDPTGGTAALDAGIPIPPGQTVTFTGKAAQSAMTQIGTNTQKLTVYTG